MGDNGMDFRSVGLCAVVDPDIFMPRKGQPATMARSICMQCPVLNECREWGISHGTLAVGIYGGLTERQRAAVRKERRLAAEAEAAKNNPEK